MSRRLTPAIAFLVLFTGCSYTVLKPQNPESHFVAPVGDSNESNIARIKAMFCGRWEGELVNSNLGVPQSVDTVYELSFSYDETWSMRAQSGFYTGTWSLTASWAGPNLSLRWDKPRLPGVIGWSFTFDHNRLNIRAAGTFPNALGVDFFLCRVAD
jgi:hypothetical protein